MPPAGTPVPWNGATRGAGLTPMTVRQVETGAREHGDAAQAEEIGGGLGPRGGDHQVPPPLRTSTRPGRPGSLGCSACVRRHYDLTRKRGSIELTATSSGRVGTGLGTARRARLWSAADGREHVRAVQVELARADAGQRRQLHEVRRPRLGDRLQGGVGEDDVGRARTPTAPPGCARPAAARTARRPRPRGRPSASCPAGADRARSARTPARCRSGSGCAAGPAWRRGCGPATTTASAARGRGSPRRRAAAAPPRPRRAGTATARSGRRRRRDPRRRRRPTPGPWRRASRRG